jgi:S-DNA-T family DNA segregation ATPase FtsK/SpoIIIE
VDAPSTKTIAAPRPPEVTAPHRFPIIATAAPLVVSALLYVVTRSAFTLVFAALGPVVAVASGLDSLIIRRRMRKREAARFSVDADRVAVAIDAAHHEELAVHERAAPTVAALIANTDLIRARWRKSVLNGSDSRDSTSRGIPVRVGTGILASGIVLNSAGEYAAPGDADPRIAETIADLAKRAAWLRGAPITVAPSTGIGVTGSSILRASVMRGIVAQLAALLSPAEWLIGRPSSSEMVTFSSGQRSIMIAAARFSADLPSECDVILDLNPDGSALVDGVVTFPEFVGSEQAAACDLVMADLARELGLAIQSAVSLPDSAEFASFRPISSRSSLAGAVGSDGEQAVVLDLVSHGPHAIVGGTTGSGKSELLVSWVLAMAAERSPSDVTFLFVDFKGGASFGALTELPHSVGVLTDLDAEQSLRALASLGAELRYRERTLAAQGLRSVDESEAPPFPRLVVVVDEYAAVVDTFPALHAAFSDVAARGRSLGVHLVLCTQRPAGVVRDGILANCALRLCLRVTSAADSVAVLGSDAAVLLPPRPLGRALVSVAGEQPALFQVAHSSAGDVARVTERWAGFPRSRAPWLPPLLPLLERAGIDTGPPSDDLPFGLVDVPAEQAQPVARYRPRQQGSLLVLGAAGSGKSGVLAAIAAASTTLTVTRVPGELARMWDVLTNALEGAVGAPRVLLIDDIDTMIAGCAETHRDGLVDLLSRLLREGPGLGVFCVLTAARAGGMLHGIVTLCGSRLVLRMPDRAEHALAGGEGPYAPNLPAGGGNWRGDRIQVFSSALEEADDAPPQAGDVDVANDCFAVVSTDPEMVAARLRERAPGRVVVVLARAEFGVSSSAVANEGSAVPAILVADADVWQSHWTLFATLQRTAGIVFDGCSLAEIRALTRSRELPPPFPRGERARWMRLPSGVVTRARLGGC